jgi:sulfur relay (sulfurtransferase) complex TusBCD TusD component (DsrE family)
MQILSIRSKVSSRGFYESLFLINDVTYMSVTVTSPSSDEFLEEHERLYLLTSPRIQ